jgi:hypothetical protein
VNRIVMAQSILDTLGGGTYLEIGVSTGASFIPMRARKKWGVDPAYQLTRRRLMKYEVFSALGIKTEKLYRITSDEFFASKRKMLKAHGVTVCLVDGLHTYQQALKDVLNAWDCLNRNGVILMHDCSPATELIGAPVENIEELIKEGPADWDGSWSGDAWKAVVHLRSLRSDLNAFVLDCDTGVGVVTKGPAKIQLNYSEAEIQAMDFNFLAEHRKELLGLQPEDYFPEFLLGLNEKPSRESTFEIATEV